MERLGQWKNSFPSDSSRGSYKSKAGSLNPGVSTLQLAGLEAKLPHISATQFFPL